MLSRALLTSSATRWLRIATLLLVPAIADASIIRSVDFEDIAAPGPQVFPGVAPDLWLGFGATPNGGTITSGSTQEGGNTFGSIDVVGAGDDWHAGQLLLFIGPLSNLGLNDFRLTADLRSNSDNVGRRAEFRIESLASSGNSNEPWDITGGLEFNPVLDDTFTRVGGKLSEATLTGNFNLQAEAFQIVFAFNDVGFPGSLATTGVGIGDNSLFFDNLVFAEAPEPSALALFGAGFMVFAARRRRRST